ncbi:30S ribosomal protein S20 [Specibacter sp. NPDC078709]|uniref:30S ribosomal protein S20 n=1 Tax=unclassified Specibacter TaxID=3081321 RepID=UPI003449ECFB
MANIKSQKKRILTNEKSRQRNLAVRSGVKTAVRAVNVALVAGDKDAAAAALVNAGRKLDKAVSKGVLHANNAANRKSALALKVNAL